MASSLLGSIRMSPLMYGSLRYIATKHQNGILNLSEVSELKQTQLRSFKSHQWIVETSDRRGIMVTKAGRQAIRSFEDNDEFFRRAAHMSFTSLLNLQLPAEIEARPVERIAPASAGRQRQHKAA